MRGLVFDIARDSYVDGPGIRTTFFMKGCHLRCRWCHNPEGQGFAPEMMFFKEKCIGCGNCKKTCRHSDGCAMCGECASVCPTDARRLAGSWMSPEDVLAKAEPDKPFFDATGGGVTFSGGECMLQVDFLVAASRLLRDRGISVAIDTAGDVDYSEFEKIIPYADVFLYDIKSMDDAMHIAYTGVSNRRILANFTRLAASVPGKLVVRVPVIPGFNATIEDMRRISELLKPLHIVPELLPYHAMGEGKAIAVGKDSESFAVPSVAEMERFRNVFSD